MAAELGRFNQVPLLIADGVKGHRAVGGHHKEAGLLPERDHATGDVVGVENLAVGIGQQGERVGIGFQMGPKTLDSIWCNGHDRGAAGGELLMSLTQLRKVLSAEGSKEPPQEDEHHRAVLGGIGELPSRAVGLCQIDGWCRCAGLRFSRIPCHALQSAAKPAAVIGTGGCHRDRRLS